jgi:uncharacterized transporter YbjL
MGMFCLIEVIVVLALVLLATKIMNLDPGTAAGMMAGAATESAVVGTATDAISRLDLPATEIVRLQSNVVTAYSTTYICGLITIVIVTSQLFPLFLRIDLKGEAEKLWAAMGGSVEQDGVSAAPTVVGRAYRIETSAGQSVAAVQQRLGQQSSIVLVKRKGYPLALSSSIKLHRGDQVLLMGYRGSLIEAADWLGTEIADTSTLSVALDTYDIVLLEPDLAGLQLAELPLPAGVHVAAIRRGDQVLPALPATRLQLQDGLQIHDATALGRRTSEPLLSRIGKSLPDRLTSNIGIIGLGIALGTWLGSFTLKIGGIPFSAGTGGAYWSPALHWAGITLAALTCTRSTPTRWRCSKIWDWRASLPASACPPAPRRSNWSSSTDSRCRCSAFSLLLCRPRCHCSQVIFCSSSAPPCCWAPSPDSSAAPRRSARSRTPAATPRRCWVTPSPTRFPMSYCP